MGMLPDSPRTFLFGQTLGHERDCTVDGRLHVHWDVVCVSCDTRVQLNPLVQGHGVSHPHQTRRQLLILSNTTTAYFSTLLAWRLSPVQHRRAYHYLCSNKTPVMICFHPSPEERQSEQPVLLSICEVELEEESNREREQHTRGPLLISSPLQTNDNESRQYSRIIMLQTKSQHLPCSSQLECRTRRHGHIKSVVTTKRN